MNSIMRSLQESWAKPKVRYTVMGLAFIGVAFMFMDVFFPEDVVRKKRVKAEVETSVFKRDAVESVDQGSIQQMYEQATKEIQQREAAVEAERRKNEQLRTEIDEMVAKQDQQIATLSQHVKALKQMINDGHDGQGRAKVGGRSSDGKFRRVAGNDPRVNQGNGEASPAAYTGNSTLPKLETKRMRTISSKRVRVINGRGDIEEYAPTTQVMSNQVVESGEETQSTKGTKSKSSKPSEEGDNDIFIPSGSIITTVAITGYDAPTNSQGQANPMPALMRVKLDTMLPNHYRANFEDCHVMVSGYGQMSSGRAYMRTTNLSCIIDGKATETSLNAFAVSDFDGKAGIKGHLVSKNGAIMARAMAAGFVSGFANAASPRAVNVVQTDPSDTSTFQMPNFGDAFGAGAFQGASNAMDKLAEYYTKLADEMYPVIEIPPGVGVSFVVQKGFTIKVPD
ncbi:TrbI/VirB10 family protein [Motilimonas eburnea]|uniref:TrbI/VirB10 family protein n=1 Tax=Motilimonas eburnea TaxID=1737488 RepID=UPI001E5226D2|nr:TrbI/VirB10 family protein [Motilimonas eburnea]MCE2571744.1 hypothetical protein [Motilimonas eburnea]